MWLVICLAALSGAATLAWRLSSLKLARRAATAPRKSTSEKQQPPSPKRLDIRSLQASGDGWLRVLTAPDLLEVVQAQRTLTHMMRESHLAPSVWERDLAVAIHRYAEFVQLMPASESHHHAHAGGLLTHTLEVVLVAMTWRNGTLLPQGAGAEQIAAERDHWTYVVFYAALLHDIGKILCDLRVQWRRGPGAIDGTRWLPGAVSLGECGAHSYHVGFTPKGERDYGAHQRMAVTLLQRIAPESARSFLAQQPHCLHHLTRYLSGEDRDSALAQLIRKADQASSAHALSSGSRARFATAASVPLIELLMGSLRDMLRQGSVLPLNRNGAAGWVYDGSVWFVAKRLADSVREHLRQHAPDEAMPGESKNDRLFDTWQEYGCITPNPQTQQAVWYVRVHGKDSDGYSHMLTMLRFPLNKIWDSADQYPAPMAGHIEVMAARESKREAEELQGELQLPEASAEAVPGTVIKQESAEAVLEPVESARAAPAPVVERAPAVRAPVFRSSKKAAPAVTDAGPTKLVAESDKPAAAAAPSTTPFVEDVLPDADVETVVPQTRSSSQPIQAVALNTTAVAMPAVDLPLVPGAYIKKGPSPVAIAFMQWLQQGLHTRSIKHNEVGAPVHFVDAGMALVSPLIFREYRRQFPSEDADEQTPKRIGLDVQREVLKAGWHIPAAAGANIHKFAVVKKGGIRTGQPLSAVVLAHPQRWVTPVPPSNPALSLLPEEGAAEARNQGGTAS